MTLLGRLDAALWKPRRSIPALPPAAKTRLLHVVLNLDFGGLEQLVADMVVRTDATRFEVHVLALEQLGRLAPGLERYATLHEAGAMSPGSLVWPRHLAKVIRSISPDVVHCHSGAWLKTATAARMAGIRRIIYTDHGRSFPDPLSERAAGYLAARRTDVVVAVSDALREQLRTTVVFDAAPVRVIENGVDTERFAPNADAGLRVRHELGIGADVPTIGNIGRLERVKGLDVMLDAFAQLLTRVHDPAPVLVVVGDGTERQSLQDRISSLGIGHAVRVLGWREDIPAMLAALTIYSMSSHSEGTSVSLLEAMSSALCPVVTNVGGNAAVLGPDLQHRLVPANDPASLAGAWERALTDPAARARDAEAARRRVRERFGLDAMVQAYERLYVGEGL